MGPRHRQLLLALLLFFLFVRLFALSADPLFIKRTGDVVDEGYWAHNPRNALLFGSMLQDDLAQSTALAPLYGFFLSLSFSAFGVSYFGMRFVNAAFGFLSIVLFYFFIKRHSSEKNAFYGILLLGFSLTFLTYNRLALVESFLGFWMLLVILLWGERKYLLSGLAMSVAILAKITALYFLPIFALLFLFQYARETTLPKRTVLFLFGLLASPVAYIAIYSADPRIPMTLFGLSSTYNTLAFLWKNIFFMIGNDFFAKIDVILIFSLVALYFFDALRQKRVLSKMGFLEYASIAWLVGGLIGVCLSDFPTRRFLPLLFPLVLLAVRGLQVKGLSLSHVVQSISNRNWHSTKGLLFSAFFAFSFFSFFNPVFARLLESSLKIPIPFYYYSILPVAFLAFIACFVMFLHRSNKAIAFCLLALIAVPLFYLPVMLLSEAFNMFSFVDALKTPWKVLILLGLAGSALFYNRVYISEKAIKKILPLFIAINLAMMAFAFSGLSFSIQQESQQLNSIIGKGETVVGGVAHELCLENSSLPIIYNKQPIYSEMNRNIKPDFLLTTERFDGASNETNYGPEHFDETKFIKDIYLLPVVHSGHYRVHAKLYCVSNERRRC